MNIDFWNIKKVPVVIRSTPPGLYLMGDPINSYDPAEEKFRGCIQVVAVNIDHAHPEHALTDEDICNAVCEGYVLMDVRDMVIANPETKVLRNYRCISYLFKVTHGND